MLKALSENEGYKNSVEEGSILDLITSKEFLLQVSDIGIEMIINTLNIETQKDSKEFPVEEDTINSVSSIIQRFENELYQNEKSDNTIKSYINSINKFKEYLDGTDENLLTFTQEDAIRYLQEESRRLTQPTITKKMSAINAFS